MKWYLLFVLLAAFVANSLALKDELCGEPTAFTGIGRAFFLRWSYDVNTNECIEFGFGGVLGNNNMFESAEDCIETCVETEYD